MFRLLDGDEVKMDYDDIVREMLHAGCDCKEEWHADEPDEVKDAFENLRKSIERAIDVLTKEAESKKHKELLPCPICGCTCHVAKDKEGKYYITCCYCPVETIPAFDTEEEAIDFWNDRV